MERQGTSKVRAAPEGTAGSSCGCSLSSKLLPRGGELRRGASARRKAQGAGHRQDISCAVPSLFLPCSEQWPQQETCGCGQRGEWIRAAVSGPEQKLLELQQGEAPHRRCEQGREDPSWEERGKGRVQGPTELPGHWARQASMGQTHRAPRRDGAAPTSRTFAGGDRNVMLSLGLALSSQSRGSHSFHLMSDFRQDGYRKTLGMAVRCEQCGIPGPLLAAGLKSCSKECQLPQGEERRGKSCPGSTKNESSPGKQGQKDPEAVSSSAL